MNIIYVKENRYKAMTVLAYVYESIKRSKPMEKVYIADLVDLLGDSVKIQTIRMSISKVCKECGFKVKTKIDTDGKIFFIRIV